MALIFHLFCFDAHFAITFKQFILFANFQLVQVQGFNTDVETSLSGVSKSLMNELLTLVDLIFSFSSSGSSTKQLNY